MKARYFFWIVLSVLCLEAHSQKYDLGDVTKEELSEKSHPKDSSAVAAVLFKKTKTVFKYSTEKGFVANTEFSVKIKIYRKEGVKWANFEIPYYTGYENLEDDNVEILKAFTYNLEEGKIKKEKVTGESKFVEQLNEFWKKKVITFPNVKPGSIIELKYSLKSEDLTVLPDFQYQYKIPVNFAEYKTEIPVFFRYGAIRIGYIDIEMKEKVEPTSQRYKVQVDVQKQDRTLEYNQIATTYTAKDVPALTEEEYVDNMDNYYARIEHELETIQYPDEKPRQIASSWESVTASVYGDKRFGGELGKNKYFLEDLKRLVANSGNEREKALAIFQYIKDRMNWNGKYGYYPKKGVESAYADKTGNVADINLVLTAMLKMAGLDAKPVLISTRSNGLAKFPSRTKFNYVIASVKIAGAFVYLDATSKYSYPNILPIRVLNGTGRMVDSDGTSIEVDLTPKIVSNKTFTINAAIAAEGAITGKLNGQYSDYCGYVFRENDAKMANESLTEAIEKRYIGTEINEYNFTNKNGSDQPILETYSFRNSNSVEIIGNKMYFSPMLFLGVSENPFKQEVREYPIDFSYPIQSKYIITIAIPDGYAIEKLPESATIPMVNNIGSLKYTLTNKEKQLQLLVTLDINSAVIPPDYYPELKSFFAEVVKKQTEKVVLKKV